MRIAVVGTCASGKSSVVSALRNRGFDAYSVAQEHSAISRLWEHLRPDRVVYLTVTIATLRQRRGDDAWPEWIYLTQLERLESAREHADIIVDTDHMSVEAIADLIASSIR